jgi:hypothetical protein
MKTKMLIMLCLFLGLGLTRLTAQPSNPSGTGTIVTNYEEGWVTGVYCDGVQIDCMHGSGTVHSVDHYVNGVWMWELGVDFHGTGESCWTGEKFTFKEIDRIFLSKPGEWDVVTHIKGDKGTLFNISFTFLLDNNWNIISSSIKNATCTGNTK